MRTNFWFESVIDNYLAALADGRNWREAVAAAQAQVAASGQPRRVLTQKALQAKGITYSRQHLSDLVSKGVFPPPFRLPTDP
jgi:hypothetical protein